MLYFMRERKHFVHEIKHYAHESSSFSCESRSFVLVRSSFTRERSYSEDEMLSFTNERSSFGCERSSFVGERLHSGRERLSLGGGIKHSVRERSLRGGEMLYRRAVRFPSRCESLLPEGLPASAGGSAIFFEATFGRSRPRRGSAGGFPVVAAGMKRSSYGMANRFIAAFP